MSAIRCASCRPCLGSMAKLPPVSCRFWFTSIRAKLTAIRPSACGTTLPTEMENAPAERHSGYWIWPGSDGLLPTLATSTKRNTPVRARSLLTIGVRPPGSWFSPANTGRAIGCWLVPPPTISTVSSARAGPAANSAHRAGSSTDLHQNCISFIATSVGISGSSPARRKTSCPTAGQETSWPPARHAARPRHIVHYPRIAGV